MELQIVGFAAYRMVNYRYMTYDKLAAALKSTPDRASALALSYGWNSHIDHAGRARVSVPESFIRYHQCFPPGAAESEAVVGAPLLPSGSAALRVAAGVE